MKRNAVMKEELVLFVQIMKYFILLILIMYFIVKIVGKFTTKGVVHFTLV
jgi:F0F1-type ATP synthase membrane subunit b/b'